MKPYHRLLALFIFCFSSHSAADELLVAVAANFLPPMEKLATEFERLSGHQLVFASGSSGKLYAQIRNGAPFQVFLSADEEKPAALIDAGLAVAESRLTYAHGRLVLWSANAALVKGPEVLRSSVEGRLAISNPRLAPYGSAAVDVLKELGVWDLWSRRLVQGENIAQTFQFVRSGNAPLGLVAASQLVGAEGSGWQVPTHLHQPIRQDAVVLQRAASLPQAEEFMRFLSSDTARAIIANYGYDAAGE